MSVILHPTTSVAVPSPRSRISKDQSSRRASILVALSGGETWDAPVGIARLVADRQGAEVHAVTTIEPTPIYVGGAEIASVALSLEPELRGAREREVHRQLSVLFGRDHEVGIDVRFGDVAHEICAAAIDRRVGLIVMGARPHKVLRNTVSGVRAAKVLRMSPCAVLSVAPGHAALARRAVAAVDFGPACISAIRSALFVLDEGATLTLVHVTPLDIAKQQMGDHSTARITADVASLFERLTSELAAHLPQGATIEWRSVRGSVVHEVLSIAAETDADLVVAGTHGYGFVRRLMVGSVAVSLLHNAECSVLIALDPPADEAMRLELLMTGTAVSSRSEEWGVVLDAFTKRNVGRQCTIEVDERSIGAQVQAHGFLFRGAAVDGRARTVVAIMLEGRPPDAGHLSRSIAHVESVAISADPRGRDRALEIRRNAGHTLVLFDD